MRNQRVKGYWQKKKERYEDGAQARRRAGLLRTHDHISHVTVEKEEQHYTVGYSVAKWYLAELEKAGIKL